MLQLFPAASRSEIDLGWLTSRRSFSFGDYFDPANTAFGVMRVCNDDDIAPGRGFGPHPHSDMEIVTVVLSGSIKHEDSLGHTAVTGYGGVQRMTAGTGVVHAEYNASETEPLSLLQLWFMPEKRGLEPSFETSAYDTGALRNALLPVASGTPGEQVAKLHQDMTIYLSRLERGHELTFRQADGRRVFLFVIDGELDVNDAKLQARDSARIEAEPSLTLAAGADAFFMLIDLP
ncbi:pirin family protein [Paenibacillus athensensis]|uniref:Pirin family protein n=1 Tax=Paenibacillus athensensis TaxID=1967502 RepID=A0A4Y8PQV3_9BACL|nr:pirin family protein [Paenibacillus athensensis]MCD1260500.1 pirin family protein [Paenibacillus athensensis]